jgi:hypothetical protein
MKIAIYHGYMDIHYEMLGYILEYFISSNISFDLYAWGIPNIYDGLEWQTFYNNLFKKNISFMFPKYFNPDNYDLIFLITDDDNTFSNKWLIDYETKMICIDHSARIRRLPINMLRLGTRFFTNRPQCLWALPTYTYLTKIDKIKILMDTPTIHVVCIGIQNRPPSGEFLKELFTNFELITFHVITRELFSTYENYFNIKTYEKCSTDKMMELLKIARYVLCLNNPKNSEPIINSISGAIPLAFNSGCQLIIPEIWNNYYNFNSVITYNDILLQKNNITTQIELKLDNNLNNVYEETYSLLNHRNRMFDLIINSKINIKPNNLNNESIYSQLCNKLVSLKPNILIKLNFNILDEINDFREIHTIYNDSINLVNLKNVYYHDNKLNLISKFIFKLCEPLIIHLDYTDLSSDTIKLLSLRGYKDIIIIENSNEDIIKLIKSDFNKMHAIYILNNVTVILSQY